MLTLLMQEYVSGAWENNGRETFTYSGTQNSECLQESFDGSVWNKAYKTSYNYTTPGIFENMIEQLWDDPNSVWTNASRAVIGRNSHDLISFIYSEERNSGDYWEKTSSSTKFNFFYESYEGENSELANLAQEATVNIYPNPTSDVLNIVIDWEKPQSSTLTIFDITGRVCYLQTIDKAEHTQTQIDVSTLPTGSYYLKINNAKGQIAKTFQVVK